MVDAKKVMAIIFAIIILMAIRFVVIGAVIDFISPTASFSDQVVEDIGGDNFLVATLNHSRKMGEESIPDANFTASGGVYGWYGAKNISFLTYSGRNEYMVVWKTTPDKYGFLTNESVNQYISDYLTDRPGKCFIEYSYQNKCVYGIVIVGDDPQFTESWLMHGILGLNKTEFPLVYSGGTPNYSVSSSGDGGHYHTVVPDRYTLSRTDLGAYYDHYEYGDNYDIDDYLESQGYD